MIKKIKEFCEEYKDYIKVFGLAFKTIDTHKQVNTALKANNGENKIDFEFPDMEIPVNRIKELTTELKDFIPIWKN